MAQFFAWRGAKKYPRVEPEVADIGEAFRNPTDAPRALRQVWADDKQLNTDSPLQESFEHLRTYQHEGWGRCFLETWKTAGSSGFDSSRTESAPRWLNGTGMGSQLAAIPRATSLSAYSTGRTTRSGSSNGECAAFAIESVCARKF